MRTICCSSCLMGGCLGGCLPRGVSAQGDTPAPHGQNSWHTLVKQECIPVGCVPPTAVAVHGEGSASVHYGLHPQVWAWRPPGCGPGDPPPGVGLETPLETCKACWDTTCKACWDTPRRPAARHAVIPPAMHAGIPTPPPFVNRMTDRCKNITLPQTSFAGGKPYLSATSFADGNKLMKVQCRKKLKCFSEMWSPKISLIFTIVSTFNIVLLPALCRKNLLFIFITSAPSESYRKQREMNICFESTNVVS